MTASFLFASWENNSSESSARPAVESPSITLDEQHDDYRFVDSVAPELHPCVKQYLDDDEFVPQA